MKRLLLFALTLPMLAACGREKLPEETPLRLPQGEIYHGLIQLGANHNVPKAKQALDDYIHGQAHK